MIRGDRKDAAQKFCLSSVELKKKKLFPFENIKHDRHEQRKGFIQLDNTSHLSIKMFWTLQ